jgi:hypothetical protein
MPARSFAHSNRDSGSKMGGSDLAVLIVASRNERAAICEINIKFEPNLEWLCMTASVCLITWPGDGGIVVWAG